MARFERREEVEALVAAGLIFITWYFLVFGAKQLLLGITGALLGIFLSIMLIEYPRRLGR